MEKIAIDRDIAIEKDRDFRQIQMDTIETYRDRQRHIEKDRQRQRQKQ